VSFTPATAVAASKTTLEGSGAIARVHDYRRMVRTAADVTALLYDATSQKINAAMISVNKISTSRDFGNPAVAGVMTTVGLQIELFRGLEDAVASEKSFRDSVFAVLQAFNTKGKIDTNASHQDPMDALQIGYIAFAGDLLLHYALLGFELRGRTSP
jgi:hypothetical protein